MEQFNLILFHILTLLQKQDVDFSGEPFISLPSVIEVI